MRESSTDKRRGKHKGGVEKAKERERERDPNERVF
jgi:hypothetical protein